MRITPLAVHEQTFRTSFRGFDPAEVDGFLQRVADELERLTEERDRLRAELEEEREVRKTLEATLATTQVLQEGILSRAKEQAEILRSQAQLRADRILAEANEQLLKLRRTLQEIAERRSLYLGETRALAETLSRWAQEKEAEAVAVPELIADPEEEEEGLDEPSGEGGGGG